MGLDMYLRLRKVRDYAKPGESYDNAYGRDWKLSESIYTVCEWRKANAVHKWFVDHVQAGEDDCGRYAVSVDKLKQLRSDCQNAMELFDDRNIEEAAQFMPTQEGFFFGSTEYDEWYREDLQRTYDACNNLIRTLESPNRTGWLSVEYESSW
jgi:hypothetical protein